MQTAVLILLWAMVLWRAPAVLRRGGPPKQRSLWFTFAALTVAMTLRLPDVMTALDGRTGVNNLSTLLKHLLGVTAAASLLEFVFGMTRADSRVGRRVRLATAGAAQLVLIALFVAMPRETQVADFYETSAGSVTATGYLLVFFGFLGAVMVAAAWLFWGSSRHAGAGWLRTGLRLLGAGTAAGVAYALVRSAYLVLRLTTSADHPSRDAAVSDTTDVLKHVAIALIVVGSSVPAAGVAWQSARYWVHLRRLRPLWSDLTAAVPEVVLHERLLRRELRLRLHRRVVEIRDALLALQPHVTSAQRDRADEIAEAAGLTGAARRTLADACWLEL
ncbi:MAB_1171c family putative transporter, partial [Streptomyces sparsus]